MTETEWGILEKNLEKSILEGFTEEVTWDGELEESVLLSKCQDACQ